VLNEFCKLVFPKIQEWRMVKKYCYLMLLGLAGLLPVWAKPIQIDNAELVALLAQGVPVVDIRTEREWRETGVVPGSILLTFFDERGNYDPQKWLQQLNAQIDSQKPFILICRSGNRTGTISQFLSNKVGLPTVYNVEKGIRSWIAEGRPLSPYPAKP
jgi:rhodanese-related sulfurtransferase